MGVNIRSNSGGDEELRSVGIFPGVGHAYSEVTVNLGNRTITQRMYSNILRRPVLVWRSLKFSSSNLLP